MVKARAGLDLPRPRHLPPLVVVEHVHSHSRKPRLIAWAAEAPALVEFVEHSVCWRAWRRRRVRRGWRVGDEFTQEEAARLAGMHHCHMCPVVRPLRRDAGVCAFEQAGDTRMGRLDRDRPGAANGPDGRSAAYVDLEWREVHATPWGMSVDGDVRHDLGSPAGRAHHASRVRAENHLSAGAV